MTVPPWSAAVQQLADGRWQPLLLITDAVSTEAEARELAEYLVRQLDARMRDVGRRIDVSTESTSVPTALEAASVPTPAFTSA